MAWNVRPSNDAKLFAAAWIRDTNPSLIPVNPNVWWERYLDCYCEIKAFKNMIGTYHHCLLHNCRNNKVKVLAV